MNLQIFENAEFGTIRTSQDEKGNVIFCAIDIAKALGYAKPRNAISTHCKGALKQGSLTVGGEQTLTFIPESDVYRLIIKSKLPSAEKFERWVFETVLPLIRKHGGYITREKLQDIYKDPEIFSDFLKQMLEVTQENIDLKGEREELLPKAQYFDNMVDSGLLVNFTTTAKEFRISPHKFINFLLDKKYLFRDTKKRLRPMQIHVDRGIFEVKEFFRNRHAGTHTLITPKGRRVIMDLLIVEGLFNPIEPTEQPSLAPSDIEDDILYI